MPAFEEIFPKGPDLPRSGLGKQTIRGRRKVRGVHQVGRGKLMPVARGEEHIAPGEGHHFLGQDIRLNPAGLFPVVREAGGARHPKRCARTRARA